MSSSLTVGGPSTAGYTGATDETSGTEKTKETGTGSGVSGGSSTNDIPSGTPTDRSAPPSTSTTGTTPSDPNASANRLGGVSNDKKGELKELLSKLTDLLKSIKDPDALATLLIEMASMQRQNALDQRLASRDAAKAQLEGQADELREAAVKEIAAAAVALVMAVVSFAVSAVSAGLQGAKLKDATDGLKEVKQLNKIAENTGDAASKLKLEGKADMINKTSDLAMRQSERINMIYGAVSGLVGQVGEAMAAAIRASAKFDEAQGQVLAANAEDTKADADQIKAFMDGVDELMRTAVEFIKKLQDAEVELMATASRL